MNFLISSAMMIMCADLTLTPQVDARAIEPQSAPAVIAAAQISGPAAKESSVSDVTKSPVADAETPQVVSATLAVEEEIAGALVFEGESNDALVEKLTAYLEGLDTLTGDFRQVAPSGSVSTGRFYLRRPGLLRFEYDDPAPLLIVANGGMVYVRDEALETTDSYPVGQTPLKFLLRKKVDLGDTKVVAVDRGIDNFAVTFASDGDETEGELTIISSAPDLGLTRWVVRDLQNGITEVALTGVKTGEKLSNRLFKTPEAGGDFLKN